MRSTRVSFLTASLWLATCLSHGVPASSQETKVIHPPDLGAGKKIFEGRCAVCHGLDGGGGRGPTLHTSKLKHAHDENSLKLVIANGIPPDMPDAWYLSEEEIADVAGFVKSLGSVPPEKVPGNAARGESIYAQKKCGMCHTLAGQGHSFGPDLSEIGSRRGAGRLRETLRDPGRTIPEEFLLVEATTSTGNTVRGIRLNEDSFTIQLRDLPGRFYSLRKNELKELKKLRGQTLMPSYGSSLSADQLDDLVAYLSAQRGQS